MVRKLSLKREELEPGIFRIKIPKKKSLRIFAGFSEASGNYTYTTYQNLLPMSFENQLFWIWCSSEEYKHVSNSTYLYQYVEVSMVGSFSCLLTSTNSLLAMGFQLGAVVAVVVVVVVTWTGASSQGRDLSWWSLKNMGKCRGVWPSSDH